MRGWRQERGCTDDVVVSVFFGLLQLVWFFPVEKVGSAYEVNSLSRLKCDGMHHRVHELSQALLDQGRSCCGSVGQFGVSAEFSSCSRREDVARSGRNAVPCMDCTFFVKRVLVVVLPVDVCHGVGTVVVVVGCVLNATAVGVAFWLPLLGSMSACAPHVTHGVEFADVGNGKATP
ncbi:hypothetical protein Taro_033849 [Colocasia esculenta]|uniref:Uncharacterized protein n=1 Tax=Colocasia esculenta TaxID=4460 RepID=A0A843VPT6_COLES|nr:hypothetical protein [Colocasia esculenta]